MTGKPNIRSIRFSDELAELIDRQAGSFRRRRRSWSGWYIHYLTASPEAGHEKGA